MKFFMLVPLFLTVSLPTELSDWNNGPEYTFDVQIKMTTSKHNSTATISDFEVQNTLKCYPSISTLLCRFGDFYKSGHPTKLFYENNKWPEKLFEIQFNDNSIKALIVHPDTAANHVNVMRAIVGQLNVGVFFHEKDLEFTATEVTYFGDCESDVFIHTVEYDESVPNELRDISILPHPKTLCNLLDTSDHKERLMIKKTRNLERCSHKTGYIFLADNTEVENINLVKSHSYITISANSFESYTENIISKTMFWGYQMVLETIKLSFVSVEPAKENLERPEDTNAIISPYVFSEITGQNKTK